MTALAGKGGKGNGAPSGAHYNLNLIGMDRDSSQDGTNGNGHRIFVKLWGNSKILLTEGSFKVTDYNGLDGEAGFRLPKADANCDGWSDYSVYVRALGKPGGGATMTTCVVDDGVELCSSESVTLSRSKGKSSFTNVSKELLTVLLWDGELDKWVRTPLFGDDEYGYLWDYDNQGLRLAQLRFYDEETFVNIDPDTGDPYEYNCQ